MNNTEPVSQHATEIQAPFAHHPKSQNEIRPAGAKPLALVVLLENVGHIHGIPLPRWAMKCIDFVTEEYAKLLLRIYGAYRHYDRVIVLEDAQATGPNFVNTLLEASQSHCLDLLLLVHGNEGRLVGYQGKQFVDQISFAQLKDAYAVDSTSLDLRMIFGVNCYGVSLGPMWLELGATITNGAIGVNWLPEPSLSVFLHNWLRGEPYSVALTRSYLQGKRWGSRIWRGCDGEEHSRIATSRQTIFGLRDITIHSV
jgi:hypothetical protein